MIKKMKSTKILFITNSCFSKTDANGRTLEALFGFINKEQLAQFYVQPANPDWEFCDNYFRVTDKDVVLSFFMKGGGLVARIQNNSRKENNKQPSLPTIKRTPIKMLLRDLVWNLNIWRYRTGFDKWVDSFRPDVIVTMVGDSSFIFNIAARTAHRKQIPILLYNTESYYFKDYNYFRGNDKLSAIFYSLFHRKYKEKFDELMNRTDYVIYGCQKLQDYYRQVFDVPSSVVYVPATKFGMPKVSNGHSKLKLTYAGNLGLNRHKSLIEIGNFLYSYFPGLVIDVYGLSNKLIQDDLNNAKGIRYHGFITPNDLSEVIKQSDILFHVESFDEFYKKDIAFGFSTKIADSLASARCFFVYAPKEMACTAYVHNICKSCTASDEDELHRNLSHLITDAEFRKKCADVELNQAHLNHSQKDNNDTIEKIIKEIVSDFSR